MTHNPHNVSLLQVGTGYRLLDTEEINLHIEPDQYIKNGKVEIWDTETDSWYGDNVAGTCRYTTYRTKLSREELRELRELPPKIKPLEKQPPKRKPFYVRKLEWFVLSNQLK